jgi:hypothetical protein
VKDTYVRMIMPPRCRRIRYECERSAMTYLPGDIAMSSVILIVNDHLAGGARPSRAADSEPVEEAANFQPPRFSTK